MMMKMMMMMMMMKMMKMMMKMMMTIAHQVVHQTIFGKTVDGVERDVELLVDFELPGGNADVQVVLTGRGHGLQNLLLRHGAGSDLLQMKKIQNCHGRMWLM